MNPNGIHSLLKNATKRGHSIVGRHPLLAPLTRAGLTIIEYGNALAALHGVYAQLEPRVVSYPDRPASLYDYPSPLKLAALEHDLSTLRRPPFPCHTKFCDPRSIGELIGVLYAIEGATQGGKIITQILRQNFGDCLPTRFFCSYGDLAPQKWFDFLRFAETVCPQDERETAATTAAQVFDSIKSHLDASHKQLAIQ